MSSILKIAQEVLQLESQAVKDQLQNLNSSFEKAVEAFLKISKNRGQIVVMGIGKSGLIGRKISATLSSTGTPAIFFHPSEGMHGDLGLLRASDAVLILSSSGETEEIKKILPNLKEKKLLLVAMTSRNNSRLARFADIVICCGVKREACPLNLTPTSSTTAMLALGDALAICLMKKKGFNSSDFAKFHPGGSLGKKLSLKVKDLMRTDKENPIIKIDSTVEQALLEMTRTKMGATHIINKKNQLVGFFTDGDLRRQLQKNPLLLKQPIQKAMTKNPKTIDPEKTLYEALRMIQRYGFDNLPVVDKQGRPVGILDERDLLAEGIY
ncbi:MAG: hypothetical protein A3I11_04375 [Elusimicrobia bacterium RIFCSPLOWO2_02_FULL_39_32]|nr:MAG: hypothetical protein A3B80_02945 [Elusimicrobia bacterium RIFCSPHIGHO2_02_FULL_39_36]OGR92932.1 MAG: hypothetical protein A3I11_04375 [Elusimicrobia bacterium RIFCSPLOWO2_02_FULL_39_32]OGR99715.1 MAG: hypothetical protein A3G85_01735 [Elusimicrobia bacterium RIFCSPLOWO2_12_FULL_39_28]